MDCWFSIPLPVNINPHRPSNHVEKTRWNDLLTHCFSTINTSMLMCTWTCVCAHMCVQTQIRIFWRWVLLSCIALYLVLACCSICFTVQVITLHSRYLDTQFFGRPDRLEVLEFSQTNRDVSGNTGLIYYCPLLVCLVQNIRGSHWGVTTCPGGRAFYGISESERTIESDMLILYWYHDSYISMQEPCCVFVSFQPIGWAHPSEPTNV